MTNKLKLNNYKISPSKWILATALFAFCLCLSNFSEAQTKNDNDFLFVDKRTVFFVINSPNNRAVRASEYILDWGDRGNDKGLIKISKEEGPKYFRVNLPNSFLSKTAIGKKHVFAVEKNKTTGKIIKNKFFTRCTTNYKIGKESFSKLIDCDKSLSLYEKIINNRRIIKLVGVKPETLQELKERYKAGPFTGFKIRLDKINAIAKKQGIDLSSPVETVKRPTINTVRSSLAKSNESKSKRKPTSKRVDDLEKLFRNLSKSNAQQTVKLIKLKRSLSDLSKQIEKERNNRTKSSQSQKTKIIKESRTLSSRIDALSSGIDGLNKEFKKIESKIKDAVDNNQIILNTQAEWETTIPRLERAVKRIQTRLKNESTSLKTPNNVASVEKKLPKKQVRQDTPENTINIDEKTKSAQQNIWLWVIPGVLLIIIIIAGIVFYFMRRSAKKEEQRTLMQQTRGRSRGQSNIDNGSDFSTNSPLLRPMDNFDQTQAGSNQENTDTLDPGYDEPQQERGDFLSLYRSALTNPAAIDRIKNHIEGFTRDGNNLSNVSAVLMKDDGVSIENADFWGMKNPENENEYYIMPGIKQNRRSARLVADDGAIANRLFEGIFTIRNGRSFDLLTVARGTLNGEQLIITQKGEVQLPN